jgi:hypothetical protein
MSVCLLWLCGSDRSNRSQLIVNTVLMYLQMIRRHVR